MTPNQGLCALLQGHDHQKNENLSIVVTTVKIIEICRFFVVFYAYLSLNSQFFKVVAQRII